MTQKRMAIPTSVRRMIGSTTLRMMASLPNDECSLLPEVSSLDGLTLSVDIIWRNTVEEKTTTQYGLFTHLSLACGSP